MESSRWSDINDCLIAKNISTYSPSTKEGECTKPYVVVKMDGASEVNGISSTINYYTILCYVPKLKYSTLDGLIQKVKEAMKTLEPMIMPLNQETPSFYDDTNKAHMISLKYRNYKKL